MNKYTLEGLVVEDGKHSTVTVEGESLVGQSIEETVSLHAMFLGMTAYVWYTDNAIAGYDVIASELGSSEGIGVEHG